jgi:hypothetical protein
MNEISNSTPQMLPRIPPLTFNEFGFPSYEWRIELIDSFLNSIPVRIKAIEEYLKSHPDENWDDILATYRDVLKDFSDSKIRMIERKRKDQAWIAQAIYNSFVKAAKELRIELNVDETLGGYSKGEDK